ncbi:MAG TPA: hypothetical protein K8V15_01805 [Tessaracoccus flavescens]|uniref:Uncharacterized protein n=1 Tax=Tessaracoccus flavescens TaxID=399497 RepID=A0A921EN37_9ACTN|nr:hypothetical protein [Tessaracoccus flavescens]
MGAKSSNEAKAKALASLAAAKQIREAAESDEFAAIQAARSAGASWSRIGELYGLTKQGAQQRFKRGSKPNSPAPADEA